MRRYNLEGSVKSTKLKLTWLPKLEVGRCRLAVSKPVLNPPMVSVCSQRLKLVYDEPLSNFAFKFKLRRYGEELVPLKLVDFDYLITKKKVRRCRLTQRNPRRKRLELSA